MLPPRTKLDDQDGVAALEFALVLPLLMALVFGIIGYGYLLSFRQSLSLAAAEGARAAAVTAPGLPDGDRIDRALDAIDAALGGGITCASAGMDCDVTVDRTCGEYGCATVSLTYDNAGHPLLPVPGLPMPTTLAYATTAEIS